MDARTVGHTVDRMCPATSVRLRLLKKRLHRDMTLSLIRELVARGDEVLDIGSYRGVYAVELARRVGRHGRVWAVEPFPANAASMGRVMTRRRNVFVYQAAASDREGSQRLTVPVYHGRGLGALATLGDVGVSKQVVDVEVRTVDGLLEERDRLTGPLSFIRCDVVGHEASVLAGAAETLRAHRPALLVEIEQRHQRSPIQETFDLLAGFGYEGYFVRGHALLSLSSFDLQRDQLSLVPEGFVPYGMPVDYVHYFLFVRPGTELTDVSPTA